MRRGSYRDAGQRRTMGDGARDDEIAVVAARANARREHQMRVGCVVALAIVRCMPISYCVGAAGGGGHIDPTDPAFP